MATQVPAAPKRVEPTSWQHYDLWKGVREAILSLPHYFSTNTFIEGIPATDIFTLNAVLGAMIEDQVVTTLNGLRTVWDPGKKYQAYGFVRQPQTFPDVLLRKQSNGHDILMGIELKGWYILAKERAPNFRFTVTKRACNAQDLICVVPWALSNVLSGTPKAYPPYLDIATYAAEKRNYYWQYERDAKSNTGITISTHSSPYPSKSDQIHDIPASDSGSNFGRLARYKILDDYIKQTMGTRLLGITADEWLKFFKKHEPPPEN